MILEIQNSEGKGRFGVMAFRGRLDIWVILGPPGPFGASGTYGSFGSSGSFESFASSGFCFFFVCFVEARMRANTQRTARGA